RGEERGQQGQRLQVHRHHPQHRGPGGAAEATVQPPVSEQERATSTRHAAGPREVTRRAGELRPPRLAGDRAPARRLDRALQQGDPPIGTPRARAPREQEGWLALPLALYFCLFFLAPLVLLAGISLRVTPQLEGVGLVQYAKFAGDPFNWSVLWQTLLI